MQEDAYEMIFGGFENRCQGFEAVWWTREIFE